MQIPAMGASEPMFNVPRVVLLLAGLMVGMQLIQILLPLYDNAGNSFKNQGDCVSYAATGGKNGPNG